MTRHADVNEVLMAPERFSSSGWEPRFMGELPEAVRAELPYVERHYATSVLSNTDPPAHRRLPANRDPEAFDEPDVLDLKRDPKHVAFGRGVHFCVGAGLSRIEAPIALNDLLERFPRMRLGSEQVRWKPNITFRGLEALPLELA